MYRNLPTPAGRTWKLSSLRVAATDRLVLAFAVGAFVLALALPGETGFAARLVQALAAFATCTTLAAFFHRLRLPRAALLCTVLLTAMLAVAAVTRAAVCDMLLTLGVTLAMSGAYLWYCSAGRSAPAQRVAAVGLGLAVLAKGLVAIALVSPLALWLFIRLSGQGVRPARTLDRPAVAVAFSLVLPWYLLAAAHQGGFPPWPVANEHGPWYSEGARLFTALLPWIATLPAFPCALRESPRPAVAPFLLAWAAVPLVLYSFAQGDADYSLAVCLPPLAAWLAYRLGRLTRHGWRRMRRPIAIRRSRH